MYSIQPVLDLICGDFQFLNLQYSVVKSSQQNIWLDYTFGQKTVHILMSLKWGHTTPYCVNVRAFSHFSHILNINGRKLKIEQYTVLQYFSPKPLYEVKWSSSDSTFHFLIIFI